MSSRNRRRTTLKRFERGYRTGHSLSASTSGSKQATIQTSGEEDTQTGSAPSETGTPVAPNSGLARLNSSGHLANFLGDWHLVGSQWTAEEMERMRRSMREEEERRRHIAMERILQNYRETRRYSHYQVENADFNRMSVQIAPQSQYSVQSRPIQRLTSEEERRLRGVSWDQMI